MTLLLINLACGLCVATLLYAEKTSLPTLRAASKILASALFVASAVANGAIGSDAGVTILTGLILCMAGDALLLPKGRIFFLAGMGVFAAGHAAYLAAFSGLGAAIDLTSAAVAAAVFAGSGLILRWLWRHLGEMKSPVSIYVGLISAMVAASVSAFLNAGVPFTLVAGAVGFAISDIAVAKDQFIEDKFINKLWGLPLYYGSQLLFANSVSSL